MTFVQTKGSERANDKILRDDFGALQQGSGPQEERDLGITMLSPPR